jgi:hypothetical protein
MTKTPAEFLEELKELARKHLIEMTQDYPSRPFSRIEEIFFKIEQFQAEQKQVSDEQNNEDNK